MNNQDKQTAGAAELGRLVGGLEPERQSYHIQIDREIDGLQGCVDHLNELIGEINGDGSGQCVSENAKTAPTLSSVLANSAERINDMSSEIHSKISEVRRLLF